MTIIGAYMTIIKSSDFRYMRQGNPEHVLSKQDLHLLKPVCIKGPNLNRALLLLHGFASSPAVYREMIPKITGYDAILCPVLPGHGTNLDDFSSVKANDWLTAAAGACKTLCETYDKVDVMGLSLGGLLAYYLSKKFPIHHLYLLAPALALKSNIPLLLNLARLLNKFGFKFLRNHAGNLYANQHAELVYRQLPLNTIIEILSFIQATPIILPSCPVDVFLGRYDKVVDSNKVALLFSGLSQTQIHWLEHSAHVLPLDGDINTILRAL